jgi:hypothetical protein
LRRLQSAAHNRFSGTFCLRDLYMLPIGQQLWLEELESYVKYPPLQAPETYNLTGILEQVKKAAANHPSD